MRRLLTFSDQRGFFVLLDSDGGMLDADGDDFAARTGFAEWQVMRDIMARIGYRYGSLRGRYRGTILSDVMPLAPEDFWAEQDEPGIRTWRRDGAFFEFSPYTLADIRTVTRCGMVQLLFGAEAADVSLRLAMNENGFSCLNFPKQWVDGAIEMLSELGLPFVPEPTLETYINRQGTITF
ncbi:MAG TPA: hypothetical protein VFB22_13545 [Candidatus Baltobacteraceae bacterium]|nr:hypothetical protein [Candidatus Baltobacteraceae bacterium]